MPRSPALSLAASTAAQSLHANQPTDPLSSTATHSHPPPLVYPSPACTPSVHPSPGVSHPAASPATPQRQRGSPSSLWTAMFAHRLRFNSFLLATPRPSTFFLKLSRNTLFSLSSTREVSFLFHDLLVFVSPFLLLSCNLSFSFSPSLPPLRLLSPSWKNPSNSPITVTSLSDRDLLTLPVDATRILRCIFQASILRDDSVLSLRGNSLIRRSGFEMDRQSYRNFSREAAVQAGMRDRKCEYRASRMCVPYAEGA